MKKLDLILSLPDKNVRYLELELLASSLGIHSKKKHSAKKPLSEEALVIGIYDALKERESQMRRTARFSVLMAAGSLIGFVILMQARQSFLEQKELKAAQKEFKQESFEGYNKKGETILEDETKQPVRFQAMEGVYEQYDDDGYLLYELEYADGLLRRKRKIDRTGRIVSEIFIDDTGKAVLVK